MKYRRLGLIMVPVAAIAVAAATINPDAYRSRVIAAVHRASGRDLTIGGRLHLVLLPWPGLRAENIALSNPPGFARPQMVTADAAELRIALLPLLSGRVEISRLTLIRPDLLLETTIQGASNWSFAPPPPSAAPAIVPASGPTPRRRPVQIDALRLEGGTVIWQDNAHDRGLTLQIENLDLSEAGPDQPIQLDLSASQGGRAFALGATSGSLNRWRDEAATTPWPINAHLSGLGAAISLEGHFTDPRRLAGYNLDVAGHAPELSALDPRLPALRDVRASAHLEESGGIPRPGPFSLETGPSDLSAWAAGLSISHLKIAAAAVDQPIEASVTGTYANAPLSLTAHLPRPDALAGARLPLDLTAAALGATLTLRGEVAQPLGDAPLDLTVSARVPDLAPFSALLRRPLPALRDIAFDGHVADEDGAPRRGLSLRDVRLSLPQGDLSGEVSLLLGPPLSLQGNLSTTRLDLDALHGAFAAIVPPASPSAGPAAPAIPTDSWHGVISDAPLDLSALSAANLDLQLQAGEIAAGGQHYAAITGHVLLQAGHLLIDRLTAQSPAGQMALRLDINAAHAPPTESLLLHAPGLSLTSLLEQAGLGSDATGTLEVEADLHGTGASPHAIAATMDGSLGVAMVGGSVDSRMLGRLFGDALHNAHIPAELGGNGRSEIRCLAVRLDASAGVAAIRALLLDMTRFRLGGAGTIDLGHETLALRLRPFVDVGGNGLVVPLRVSGSWRRPTATGDGVSALAAKGAEVAPAIGALASAGEHLLGDADVGNCAPSLALARDGRLGTQPGPPKVEKPLDLLKGLFKKK